MGDGRRAGVIVVVVIAVRVYNDNFSFSTVFVTIRENKKNTYRLGGTMPPSPSPPPPPPWVVVFRWWWDGGGRGVCVRAAPPAPGARPGGGVPRAPAGGVGVGGRWATGDGMVGVVVGSVVMPPCRRAAGAVSTAAVGVGGRW